MSDLRIITSGLNKGLKSGPTFRDIDTGAVAGLRGQARS